MSKIKPPEEWNKSVDSNIIGMLYNTDLSTKEIVANIHNLQQAYHEYASKLEMEQKIEEIKNDMKDDYIERKLALAQGFNMGLRKAIEILKK